MLTFTKTHAEMHQATVQPIKQTPRTLELIRLLMKFDYGEPAVGASVCMFALQSTQYQLLTWMRMWLHHATSVTSLVHDACAISAYLCK